MVAKQDIHVEEDLDVVAEKSDRLKNQIFNSLGND